MVTRIIGQMKLQALDFWVRNPDYLADELLTDWETSGDDDLLVLAETILDGEEPELRKIPMVRWLYGAFERLDDSFAVLRAVGLADILIRRGVRSVREYEFRLLQAGSDAVERLVAGYPQLDWYRRRAEVVGRIAGASGGKALKDRQYRQATYGATPLGTPIPEISGHVRARLAEIRAR